MLSASAHWKWPWVMLFFCACLGGGCKARGTSPAAQAQGGGAASPVPPAPADLAGIVVDRLGAPLPDVLVIAWPKGKRGQAVAQARTGEDGRFVLPRLMPGTWMMLVETGGLGTLETERQIPSDELARLALEGEGRAVSGMVVDANGKPAHAAEVTMGGPGLRWTRVTKSDANGSFVLGGIGLGRYTLRARLGKLASPASVVVLEPGHWAPVHVRLAVQEGVTVAGRVVDDTGQALAGAAVDIMAVPADDLPIPGQTGSDGRFEIGPVPAGRYQIVPRLDDYVPLDAPLAQVGGRPRESFDLRMARPARVLGRVRDEAGRPLAGASVTAISLIGGKDDLVVIQGALPLAAEAALLPVGKLLRGGGSRSSSTDGDGSFTLTGLAPGRTQLEILHPDKIPFRRETMLLVPGDARNVGEMTLVAGASLSCVARDEEGHALDGARVVARPVGKSARVSLKTTTDGNGEFSLRVPLGDYALSAETQDRASLAPTQVSVRADVGPDVCVLRLAAKAKR